MIDIDSFIGEVHLRPETGRRLPIHPPARVSPDHRRPRGPGEVLQIRKPQKRKANPQRGAARFVDELIARVRRAGHHATIII